MARHITADKLATRAIAAASVRREVWRQCGAPLRQLVSHAHDRDSDWPFTDKKQLIRAVISGDMIAFAKQRDRGRPLQLLVQ